MNRTSVGGLDLNLIPVFDALLTHRNVTRAAEALSMTQSAVSHALGRMRTTFGDPLFTRGAFGVTPTSRALELAPAVAEIAARVRGGLLASIPFAPEAAARTLTLCMADLGEVSVLPTLARAVREASPACVLRSVQAQPSEVRAMLEAGDADLVIGTIASLPTARSEIYGQKLFVQSSVVIANRVGRPAAEIDLDDYCAAPHIAFAADRGRLSLVDDTLARLGRRRNVVLSIEHYLPVPHLVRADPTVIATAPRRLGDLCRDDPALRVLELPFELPTLDVFQYWHARSHRDAFHVWFRGVVAHFFQHGSAVDAGDMPVAHDLHA